MRNVPNRPSSVVALGFVILLGIGCDDTSGPDLGLFRGIAATIETGNPDVLALGSDEDGNLIAALSADFVGSGVAGVGGAYFRTAAGAEFTAILDASGRPSALLTAQGTILFGNYTENTVDLAFVDRGGGIVIERDVPLDNRWFTAPVLSGPQATTASSAATALRWASIAAGGAVCVAGLATTAPTFGLSSALVATACATTILRVGAELSPSDDADLQRTASTFGVIATVGSCGTGEPVGCVSGAADFVLERASEAIEVAEQEEEAIRLAQGALESGTGSVQITLTWNTTADLDLWVTDPGGERIYFANSTSQSGGQLDRDDVNGFGPENIFWPRGGAPSGEYLVQVDHFSGASPTSFEVLVQQSEFVKKYEGVVRRDQTETVARFRLGHALPTAGQLLLIQNAGASVEATKR